MKTSKIKLYLRFIARLGIVTSSQFHHGALPGLSEERARGVLSKLKREGYINSSEMPKNRNQVFYFITKKGLRLIGQKSKWTHASCFKPRSLYEVYARSLFSCDEIDEPGFPTRILLRPSDFKQRFPEYANGISDKHFCIDSQNRIYALRVVATPPANRLVSDSIKRFRRYMEHKMWRQVIAERRFSFVLILPSEGKAEQIQAELDYRKLNRQLNSPEAKSTPLEELFAHCLMCWPSAELGRLLL